MICQIFSHGLRAIWRALSTFLQGPCVAVRMIAGSAGAVLMLLPAEAAWPYSSIADSLASAAAFDWLKAAMGLIFILWRQFGTAKGVWK